MGSRDVYMIGPIGRQFAFVVETTRGRFGSNGQTAGTTDVFVDDESGYVTVVTVAFPGMEVKQPSLCAVEKAAGCIKVQRARNRVLENVDLVAHVLLYAELTPESFVGVGRISKAWRAACRINASLLLKASRARPFLTKRVFCGLFGLSPAEADAYPHGKRAHKTGLMYMFSDSAIGVVIEKIGGMDGWEHRLAARAVKEPLTVFGPSRKRARSLL